MPRDVPLANGNLLVTFNKYYQICGVYYPHIGDENHADGQPFRIGIWIDGRFSWVGPEWDIRLDYQGDTLVTHIEAMHQNLDVELTIHDAVDFDANVLVRRLHVKNLSAWEREVRLFFTQNFILYGANVGDTAYYDPSDRSLIHYKKERYFLICGATPRGSGVDAWATGLAGFGHAEGTWRDAEDGHLSGQTIAQGAVDSTVGFHLTVPGRDTRTVSYWFIAGTTYREVHDLNAVILTRSADSYIERTKHYWHCWVTKESLPAGTLSESAMRLYRRSLLVIRTQIDNGGAIIAANDTDIQYFNRDNYSYLWPRDGALVAYALDLAGYSETTRRYFYFCGDLLEPEGYYLQKYHPDGTLASTWHPWYFNGQAQNPVQEDQTALTLWAIWQHFLIHRDVELVRRLYERLIKPAADFLAGYRHPDTGLPLPSYDLWEERRGALTFTTSAVWGGLTGAAYFAGLFGEQEISRTYTTAAEEIKAGMLRYLYDERLGRFVRMINVLDDGSIVSDPTIDASLYGLFAYGPFDANDEHVVATMEAVRDRLWVKTPIGGVARYENDYYHQVSQDITNVPGNPWFICTTWLGLWDVARAKTSAELKQALPIIEWVAARALRSGVLAEQVDPYTNAPLSVSPLTWSHAAFITLVREYLSAKDRMS